LQQRFLRSLTLRFTVDDGGRMRCRITEALRERFWMVADAEDLYRTVRALIREDTDGDLLRHERDVGNAGGFRGIEDADR
jgi:hypothetical protein